MLKPRKDKGKTICVGNNDDVGNFDDGGRYFIDDYFELHILDNDRYVQNEAFNCSQDLVNICDANGASNESVSGVNLIDQLSHICGSSRANSDGVPVEVNDCMSPQVDYEFVENQNITSE